MLLLGIKFLLLNFLVSLSLLNVQIVFDCILKTLNVETVLVDEMDGYHTGAIANTYQGIKKSDPNYSSKDISIEDF